MLFEFPSYGVSRRDKEPLLEFLVSGLRESGCTVLFTSPANREPFIITFDTPTGERMGVAVYAFLANSKLTKNRPADEHRFQVKLGSDTKRALEMLDDETGLLTTLFVGIDTERGFLVGADPAMHNPSPMFISIEFKARHAQAIAEQGWFQWERDRRAREGEEEPAEVLVGAVRSRLLDYIRFERAARGLDQGHRQLLAEKFELGSAAIAPQVAEERHRLVQELGLDERVLFDLIADTGRLKMAVRGWVAEVHLEESLREVPGVTECHRPNAEGYPDISVRWRGSPPILIECKNVLRKKSADGSPRLDFQRTRASTSDPCSRYYQPEDFSVVAACLHAVTEKWDFVYARTLDLPPHAKCSGRINSALRVGNWVSDPSSVLDAVVESLPR